MHALPIATIIKEHEPQSKIGWVVRERCADIVVGNPNIDKTHVIANKPRFNDLMRLSSELKRECYETCLDMQGLSLSGLIALLSGAKKRIGLDLNRECNRLFLTQSNVPGYKGQDRHAVDILKGFLPPLGISIEPGWPTLSYLAVALDSLTVMINPDKLLVSLNLGASSVYKQWPLKNWIELSKLLLSDGLGIALIGGNAERVLADEFVRSLDWDPSSMIDAVGRTNLRQSAGLIERSALLVSPDSGMMHLGVAVGTPVIGLFGSTNPNKTGPYGERNEVIWPKIACAPCYRHPTCEGRVDCMKMITPGQVKIKIDTLLSRSAVAKV